MRTFPLLIAVSLALLAVASSAAIERQTARFKTHDNVGLIADYFPAAPAKNDAKDAPGAPIVILLHMYRHDRTTWKPLIQPLHDAGFAVLALDLRGHGDSATPKTRRRAMERDPVLFAEMKEDVRAAREWLGEQPGVDASRVTLVGASVGCSVALRYAGLDPSVDAVVCMTPGVDYLGLDSVADIKKIKGRHVLLLAAEDERAAVDRLKAEGPAGVETKVFDKATESHGTRMFGRVEGVEKTIVDFLTKHAGEPTDKPFVCAYEGDTYWPADAPDVQKIEQRDRRFLSSEDEARQRGLSPAKNSAKTTNT